MASFFGQKPWVSVPPNPLAHFSGRQAQKTIGWFFSLVHEASRRANSHAPLGRGKVLNEQIRGRLTSFSPALAFMSNSVYSEINFHITWYTKTSLPMIDQRIESRLYHNVPSSLFTDLRPLTTDHCFTPATDHRPLTRPSCPKAVIAKGDRTSWRRIKRRQAILPNALQFCRIDPRISP